MKQCNSITSQGVQCKRKSLPGRRYCWQHDSIATKFTLGGLLAGILVIIGLWADLSGLGFPLPNLTDPTLTGSEEAAQSVVNTNYLAALVGKEPFTEQLPQPLISLGFESVMISDASAARKLTAVQIKLAPDLATGNSSLDLQSFAHIEIYQTRQEAQARSRASRDLLVKRYETGLETMSDESFCVSGYPDFWTCAGYRGFAYAEVTISPGSNANRGLATGVLSALLRYTDKMTALATS